ncbi:MAG: hypothetical protein ABI857_00680 [Acidobacteriota bacterium]
MTSSFHTILILSIVIWIAACGPAGEAQKPTTPDPGKPAATPSKSITPADIAKLKWIEGTWRGMDGDKPFYERYKIEENAMVVQSLKEDGTLDGEADRFELTNGEFGKGESDKRSAASEITETHIQFVPAVPGKGNNFRFEKQSDGTWIAILEWPATSDKPARQKIYLMGPWQPKK